MTALTFRCFSLLVISALLMMNCSNDDDAIQPCVFSDSGLIGTWEITDRSINGISDGSACCEILEFSDDGNRNDCRGNFRNTSVASEVLGSVEISTDNTIRFEFDGQQLTYDFEVSMTKLTFEYTENGELIEECWIRFN